MRSLPLLLLLFLTPTAAGALQASPGENGLRIQWSPQDEEPVLLTISHEEDGVRVVDWARSVLPGTERVELEVEGLPAAAGFSVALWNASADMPVVSGASSVPASLPDGTPTASVEVASRASLDRRFPAYRVSEERASEDTARVLVVPSGAVVAAWTPLAREVGACVLRVASSLDGGHAFGEPVEVARTAAGTHGSCHGLAWAVAGLGSGAVAIVWDVRDDDRGAGLALIDPTTGELEAVPLERGLRFAGKAAAAPDAHGGFLLGAGSESGGFHVWRVGLDGSHEEVLTAPGGWVYGARATAVGGGVAFAWADHDRVWHVVSRDGGASFSEPTGLPLGVPSQVHLHAAHLSATGTLHVAASNAASGEAWYVRVLRDGGVQVRGLCGEAGVLPDCHRAQAPMLVASGPSVWLLFERFAGEGWEEDAVLDVAAESRTDGASFGEPYRLRDRVGQRMSVPFDMALFPDGRPLLYALMIYGGSEGHHAVVPFFDPLGPADARNATLADLPRAVVPDHAGNVSVALVDGVLTAAVRNDGARTWRDVRVVVGDAGHDGGRWVTPGGVARWSAPAPAGLEGSLEVRVQADGVWLGEAVPVFLPGKTPDPVDAPQPPEGPDGPPELEGRPTPAPLGVGVLLAAWLSRRRV